MECFYISTKIPTKTSWKIGGCSFSYDHFTPGLYTESCCLLPGEYILTCTNPEGKDWSHSGLTLHGHAFCNDYVGRAAMIRLNITGNFGSTNR